MTPTPAKPQFNDWIRYPAAVVVALLASVATAVLLGMLGQIIRPVIVTGSHPVLDTVAAFCVEVSFKVSLGFSGIFVGSMCFRRTKRFFGSVLLLLLGVGFTFRILYVTTVERGDSFPFGYFSLVVIGGAAAVAIIYWRQQTNTRIG